MDAKIEVSPDVVIVKVKVNLQCRKCKHTWGVTLLGNGEMPRGSDVCSVCNSLPKHDLGRVDDAIYVGELSERNRRLFMDVWSKLSQEQKQKIKGSYCDIGIYEADDLSDFKNADAYGCCLVYPRINGLGCMITLSKTKLLAEPDGFVMYAIAHELGHAYQSLEDDGYDKETNADLFAYGLGLLYVEDAQEGVK
jgi:hypothetical protein